MTDTNQVVTQEIAEVDFERMLKAARVKWEKYKRRNPDEAEFDREDVIDAIMDGTITIDDGGFPELHFSDGPDNARELKFKRRILGRDMSAAGRSKSDNRAFYFAAGAYFGVSPSELEALETGDIALLQTLWVIFLRN